MSTITILENDIINYLKEELKEDLIEAYRQRERRIFVRVKPIAVRRAVQALKRRYQTLRFMTLSAVDNGLDMEYLYHLHIDGVVLTVRSIKPKEDNTLESIADIIPAANFIEREISDLFGIKLINHPQPEHGLILTRDWPDDKRPLRKPLEGALPPKARPVAEALISSSCVAPISAFIQKKREEAGLPKSASFAFTDERALNEFHSIIRDTGLSEKVGFDWEKKRLRYK
ncbi:MAG: NADH-quinone oxidoreductase subunit C [Candidatus Bathyarchaeia archaeon]|nr:NADH-quinone oxidoreductase subunit C [Candidatus Bathyarchaeota archaeon]